MGYNLMRFQRRLNDDSLLKFLLVRSIFNALLVTPCKVGESISHLRDTVFIFISTILKESPVFNASKVHPAQTPPLFGRVCQGSCG